MKVAIVTCMHGDEGFGVEVINRLKKLKIKNVKFLIANQKAFENKTRFVDADLNKSFPGNPKSNVYEEKLAYHILDKLNEFDVIIDLHFTNSNIPPIAFITRNNKDNIKLAKSTGVDKICLVGAELNKCNSLLDYVNYGVRLKFNNNYKSVNQAFDIIYNTLVNLNLVDGFSKPSSPEMYEIFGVEDNINLNLNNFIDYTDYTPIMVDGYEDIKCLKAKRLN